MQCDISPSLIFFENDEWYFWFIGDDMPVIYHVANAKLIFLQSVQAAVFFWEELLLNEFPAGYYFIFSYI